MNSFLKEVAHDIISTFGCDLHDIVVVFPNKRAQLFLNEQLAQAASQPLWAPRYQSISDLFGRFSSLQVAEPITLVCVLYQCYLQVTGKSASDESLDQFFGWGQILVADFDDLDKNLVDAHKLFRNLQDLKQLDADTRSYLSPEQLEVLKEFFLKFRFDETELQQRFARLWDVLAPLYDLFNERLRARNLCYEGALFRQVVQELTDEQLTARCYLFVGFNVLNKVEERLFALLQQKGKARFYWDYDTFYTQNAHEAGRFLTRNLQRFGNALPEHLFTAMQQPKEVDFIAASTDSAQVRQVAPWLNAHLTPEPKHTAVVLCNEHLLEPVLHVLPPGSINITMGFPLADTPISGFVQALCRLYLEGFSPSSQCFHLEAIAHVLSHPYARLLTSRAEELLNTLRTQRHFLASPSELQLDEALRLLFPDQISSLSPLDYVQSILRLLAKNWQQQPTLSDDSFAPLYQEALFKAHTLCNRLSDLVEEGLLTVTSKTLTNFILQLMASQSIPFHGEPAIGLQVMGVLETRNLDFEQVVLLSVNEGMLPKAGADASFIPYNLRKAFGMTLIEQKVAVYAYYFYRLIQRAKHVTLMYNSNTQGLQKGEMSRFMLQYLVEHPHEHTVRQFALGSVSRSLTPRSLSVNKTAAMVQSMLQRNRKRPLSPSALNTYIDCPLQYYFKYVARLRTEEEVTGEIDNALFGTLFHRCCELVYGHLAQLRDGVVTKELLDDALQNDAWLQATVQFAFKELLFGVAADCPYAVDSVEYREFVRQAPLPLLNGTQTIVQSVIHRYLRRVLEFDRGLESFRIVLLEGKMRDKIDITVNGQPVSVCVEGTIDRLDECTDPECGPVTRVVDYKTSDSQQTASNLEALFKRNQNSRPYHITQALFYALLVSQSQQQPSRPLVPSLYYVSQTNKEFQPTVVVNKKKVTDFVGEYEADYRKLLNQVLEEMFNADHPFVQTTCEHACEFCDYRSLCQR